MTKGIQLEIGELLDMRYYASSLKLHTNLKRINSYNLGDKLSHARGRGMDFAEVRHYQAGDDIRLIHWPLTARLGKPFTKIYHEERERNVYLLIDQSISMKFGTRVAFKHVIAAKVAALLGFRALLNQEQIGGVIFNDEGLEYIKPKRSRQSLLDIFNILINNKTNKYQGGLQNALKFISQHIQSGSSVIVISDYSEMNIEVNNYLRLIARIGELTNILVYDPLEANLPESGTFTFTCDGKSKLEINSTKHNKEQYSSSFIKRVEQIKTLSMQNKMRFIKLATNDDIIDKVKYGVIRHES